MRLHSLLAIFAVAALAATAFTPRSARAEALTEEERAKLAEPERGFYAEFDFGSFIFMGSKPCANSNNGCGAGDLTRPGILTGVGLGSDIGKNLQFGAHIWATTNNSTGQIFDVNGTQILGPDAQAMLVVGYLKGLYPTGPRFNWTARVSAGMMLGTPKPSRLYAFDPQEHVDDPSGGDNSPVLGFGAGMEYYTKLRHFSIGAEFSLNYALGPGGLAIQLYPVIKYTF